MWYVWWYSHSPLRHHQTEDYELHVVVCSSVLHDPHTLSNHLSHVRLDDSHYRCLCHIVVFSSYLSTFILSFLSATTRLIIGVAMDCESEWAIFSKYSLSSLLPSIHVPLGDLITSLYVTNFLSYKSNNFANTELKRKYQSTPLIHTPSVMPAILHLISRLKNFRLKKFSWGSRKSSLCW